MTSFSARSNFNRNKPALKGESEYRIRSMWSSSPLTSYINLNHSKVLYNFVSAPKLVKIWSSLRRPQPIMILIGRIFL